MPLENSPEYITTKEVTMRFRLSWDYLRKSGLTCYRLGHRTVLWKVTDILEHIAKSKSLSAA